MSEVSKAINTIDEQIENEEELEEINLDQIHFAKFTQELKNKLESLKNLASLSLNDCGLTDLENFPNIPSLIRLELIDNNLDGSSLHNLSKLGELQSLSLGGNKINSYDDLKPLLKLSKLFQLDLINCDICEHPDYRQKLFEMFPNLGILDNKDKDGNDVEYDDDEDGGDGTENEDDEEEDDFNDDEDDEEEDEEDEEEEDEEDDDDEDEDEKQKAKKKQRK